jgi:phosphoglycerol transferase MdoB-like AlkP superfamily enzyme
MSALTHFPLFPFLSYSLLLLAILSSSRLLLMLWKRKRVATAENALKILGYGLRFDVISICYLWMLPALLLILLPETAWLNSAIVYFTGGWFFITTILFVFMEISTPAFIDQFDTRPNRLFFEYLETPVEVIKTSVMEYPWHFVVAAIVLGMLGNFLLGFHQLIYADLTPLVWWLRLLLLPLLFLLLVMGARSSFDHRPANASIAAFSNDQLLNKLGLNSTFTLLDAAASLRNEETDNRAYGQMDAGKMVGIVRDNMLIDKSLFVDDPLSTWHRQAVNLKTKKSPNLIIILEESLGAGFSGKLGGVGVTPELDKLADEGLWFSNLFAIGTRSARGIEAVVSGFPPSPSRSVLKLGLAQQHFPTIASILKQHDYDTQFIYGGESHFDNMAGFFLANGFDRVTDESDFNNPSFRGTWGVSDEDVFDRVHEEMDTASSKPQLILAFTSSNHSPFQFPDGKFELHDKHKATVNNAVKYADYALGQFFDKARQKEWWDNTYFLVVADHDTRVFGASLVPVNKFHIPALILGPDIEAQEYSRLSSQIDLAPTVLSLMGITSSHPMIGHDVTRLPADFAGRAMMQYDDNHAWMQGDDVVVHVPEKEPKQFVYRDKELEDAALQDELCEVAKAHALWPMYAYRHKKYLSQ